MRTLLNIIWLVLACIWLAFGYCIAAVLMAITTRHKGLSVVGPAEGAIVVG